MKVALGTSAPSMSPADRAAHRAASYVRPVRAVDLGDSDPVAEEALRRVRGGWFPNGGEPAPTPDPDALHRVTTEVAYIEYDSAWRTEYGQFVGEVAA